MIWKPQKREGGTPSPSRPPQTIPVHLLRPFFLSFANSAMAILHSTAQPHFLTPHEPDGPGSCQHFPSSAFGGYGPHLTQVQVTGDAGAIDLGAAQDGPCTSKSQDAGAVWATPGRSQGRMCDGDRASAACHRPSSSPGRSPCIPRRPCWILLGIPPRSGNPPAHKRPRLLAVLAWPSRPCQLGPSLPLRLPALLF